MKGAFHEAFLLLMSVSVAGFQHALKKFNLWTLQAAWIWSLRESHHLLDFAA